MFHAFIVCNNIYYLFYFFFLIINLLVMRKSFVECKTRYQALKLCPWAASVAKVSGGFFCFESRYDYKVWKNQK